MSAARVRDVVVVGSGPAGYTAAIYAARAGRRPVVVEGSVTAGGALMNTTEVENYPGFPDGVQGPELMAMLRAQAERFGAELVADDAIAVDLAGPVKSVETAAETLLSRSVVLAMGSAYRQLGVDGEDRLSGRGVSWCATCDGFFFRDKHVLVVGGGDSAAEEATFLSRFARTVTLVHRRGEMRASRIMRERVAATPGVQFAWHREVREIHGEDKVTAVTLRDPRDGATERLDVDGIFVAIGHSPRSELVRDQLECDDEGYVRARPGGTITGIGGVFACGDLVDRRYRQAITAAGSGCQAALDVEEFLAASPVVDLDGERVDAVKA